MWDLKDKIVVISGATNGIGKAAAFELAKHSPKLLLTYRNQDLADSLVDELKVASPGVSVELIYCDFSAQSSIRECAIKIISSQDKIDVLINNAGVVNTTYHETSEGIENLLLLIIWVIFSSRICFSIR